VLFRDKKLNLVHSPQNQGSVILEIIVVLLVLGAFLYVIWPIIMRNLSEDNNSYQILTAKKNLQT